MSNSNKTFQATWNNERFECWHVSGQIRFKRAGEVGFKSMSEAEFWRYFKPVDAGPKPEAPAVAVQGGLFG